MRWFIEMVTCSELLSASDDASWIIPRGRYSTSPAPSVPCQNGLPSSPAAKSRLEYLGSTSDSSGALYTGERAKHVAHSASRE